MLGGESSGSGVSTAVWTAALWVPVYVWPGACTYIWPGADLVLLRRAALVHAAVALAVFVQRRAAVAAAAKKNAKLQACDSRDTAAGTRAGTLERRLLAMEAKLSAGGGGAADGDGDGAAVEVPAGTVAGTDLVDTAMDAEREALEGRMLAMEQRLDSILTTLTKTTAALAQMHASKP